MQRSKGSENINAIIESVESRNNNSQQPQELQCNSNSQKNTRRSLSTSRIPSRNKSYTGRNELSPSPLAAFDLKNFPYAGFTRLDDILTPKAERSSTSERYCSYSQTSIKLPSTSNQNNGNNMIKDGFKLLLEETKGASSSSVIRNSSTSNVNNFETESPRITLKKVKPLLHIRSSLSKSVSKDLKSVKRPAASYSSQDEIDNTQSLSPNKNSSPRIQMSNGNPHLMISSTSLNSMQSQNKELNSNYLLKPAVKSLNYTQSDSSIKQLSSTTLNNNCSSNSNQSGTQSNLHSYHRSVNSNGNVANHTQGGSNHSQHQQSIRKVASTSAAHFPTPTEKYQQKKHSSSINISGNSSNNNKGTTDSNLLVDINKTPEKSTSKYVAKNHSSNVSTCSSSSNSNSLLSSKNSSKKVKNKCSINLISFEEDLAQNSNDQKQTMIEDLSKQIKNLIKENITLNKKMTYYENRDREKNSGESKLSPPVDRGKASKSSAVVGQNLDKSIIINDNHKAIENSQLKSQVETLKYQNDQLKDENKLMTLENQKINRLLRDLLYTLNARGFEILSDGLGNTIDLNRCKGETLLEMKGRDTRNRNGVKKNSPQEMILKAVIGSQERLIQNLVTQLDTQSRQRDLIANGQLMQGQNLSNTPGSRGDIDRQGTVNNNANPDGEVLALKNVLEAICMRSHEVFFTLKDYLEAEYRERNVPSAILENVVERCERYLSPDSSFQPQSHRTARSKMKSNKRMLLIDQKSNSLLMTNPQPVPRGRSMANRSQQSLCQLSHQQHQHHQQQMQQSHLKMSNSKENSSQLTSSPSARNPHSRVNKPFPCLNSFPMLKIIDGSESTNGHSRGTSAPSSGITIFGNNSSTTMITSNSPRHKHKIKPDSSSNSPRNPASSHMVGPSTGGQHQSYQFQHEDREPHVCKYCHKIFDYDTPQSQISAHYDLHFFKRNEKFDDNSATPKPSTS